MQLYITHDTWPSGEILTAYWAESPRDAIDAYESEGIDAEIACTMLATPEEALLYHGPDFDGRKAYWVIPLDGGDPFAIAADSVDDALDYAYKTMGSYYAVSPVPMTREWADACLEPGWDQ